MPYIDGLPPAGSVSLLDLIAIDQGGTPGIAGTATTRRAPLSLLLGTGSGPFLPLAGGTVLGETFFTAAGTGISVTNGLTAGSALFGTGTPTGNPYQFQSAINFDPSSVSANFRYNMFNTTLTYASDTSNIWQNVYSVVNINGPGHANGELSNFHGQMSVNAGATANQMEGMEVRLDNNGTITGPGWLGHLVLPINNAGATASSIAGVKFSLTNNNSAPGSVASYVAITNIGLSGSGSQPTVNEFIHNADPNGAIVSLGSMRLGSLQIPGSGTLLEIDGTDNISGTFPFIVRNLAGNNTLYADNSGVTHMGAGNVNFGPLGSMSINGADTSSGTFPISVRNSASTSILSLNNAGTFNFLNATGATLFLTGPDNSSGTFPLGIKNLAGTVLFAVDDTGATSFAGGNASIGATGIVTGSVVKTAEIDNGATGLLIGHTPASTIAFYGAAPVVRPTVTGSRGGNAALASLLTSLGTLNLIFDSSTP